MPFVGPAVGENTDREGDESKRRRERCGSCKTLGVGGIIPAMLRAKVVCSEAGVRIVKFAGFRRPVLGAGLRTGDEGAE